jgi:argininosuccinate lyase
MQQALSPEVFATDAAYDLVAQGVPFRDAYRQVAEHLDQLASVDPVPELAKRTHLGASGNLGLPALRTRLDSESTVVSAATASFRSRLQRLVDGDLG